MQNSDVRKIVDVVMAKSKSLVGKSTWQLDPDGDAWRWLGIVEIDDEQPGVTLVVKYYPQIAHLQFSIMLNFVRCISRLDFTNDEHVNPLNAPSMAGMLIREPHYHSWSDNRVLAAANSLPKRIPNARLLPKAIQSFAPAFRWFLDETNIYVEPGVMPELPKRATLL